MGSGPEQYCPGNRSKKKLDFPVWECFIPDHTAFIQAEVRGPGGHPKSIEMNFFCYWLPYPLCPSPFQDNATFFSL